MHDEVDPPYIKQDAFGADILAIDLTARIGPAIFESVIDSAKIVQNLHFDPFEPHEVIYDTFQNKLLAVHRVLDNRHRDSIREMTLECYDHEQHVTYINANVAIHLGHIVHEVIERKLVRIDPKTPPDQIGEFITNMLRGL